MEKSDTFSDEAQVVWGVLTAKQKGVIQANYPIKAERNSLICQLRSSRVEVQILSEISGLSRQSISKIVYREADPDKATLQNLKMELKKIQKAVGRLGAHIARIEKNQKG